MTQEEKQTLRVLWKERVRDFRASGMTAVAWCAEHQLKTHQLWYWIQQYEKSTSSNLVGFEGQKMLVLSEQALDAVKDNPLAVNCFITDIGFFPAAKYHFRERQEGSSSHIIIICTEGSGWVRSDGMTPRKVTKGQWFLVPARLIHCYGADEERPWSIYWVHFKGQKADEIVQYILGRFQALTPIPLLSEFQIHFLSLFDEVYSVLERGITNRHMAYAASVARHMLGFLQFTSESVTQLSQRNQVVERTQTYMQARIHDNVSLQELAENVNLSTSQFTHLFKTDTGRSPIDYFLHLKMQRACQYLDMTDWTIKEISLTLNISDPYYFSRLFHRMIGLSPTNYRLNRKG